MADDPAPAAEGTDGQAAERARSRRTFGPVVLLGLATSGLAAVASAKPWMGGAPDGSGADATMAAAVDTGTHYPLASAVSLVLLAAWGVLLVTRGRVRQVFAVLAVLGALALLACVVVAHGTLPDTAGDSYQRLMGRGEEDPGFTGWFWTAGVAALAALVPAGLAVRHVRHWPEMGSRYDAPATAAERGQQQDDQHAREPVLDTDRDLWQALDEGRDPTDTSGS